MVLMPERTVRYKTYVKRAIVEALRGVFKNHPDELMSRTKVDIEYPKENADYPTVLVRFFERDIQNMGVGHIEHIQVDGPDGQPTGQGVYPFKHYLYHADIELAVKALSSLDRDLISDTLVQTLGMGTLESYTNTFFERIYPEEGSEHYPDSIWHFININTDKITGIPETVTPTPWGAEDELIYESGYRTNTMGEFYSVPPDMPVGYVSEVLLFPYIGGLEAIPDGDSGPGQDWKPGLFD